MSQIALLHQVSKSYQAGRNAPVQEVLRGVNLQIKAGETLAITGPSGCGKSTLLHILGTLDRPDSGTVTLFGDNVGDMDEAALSRLRADRIGFIFQLHHLLPHLTALENVLVPTLAGAGKTDRKAAAERARKLLDRVGLSAHTDKKPSQLSGGEQQRVAVVRALIRQPGLLLADEPTGALDAATGRALMDLLLELNAELHTALVVVTHDPKLAALMKRPLHMADGKLSP
ncbi:MAG TPA: ABC transporter ATP-binding protein [Verrucomicrobiales bacterium]|nr:ABC transporter ATP-binding protein [Verrucomicrobiales bacterium]